MKKINFFTMFNIAHKERTHSDMLFELFHYKEFQEIFIKELYYKFPEIKISKNNAYSVKKEFSVNKGFIDILLYNSIDKSIILIENKFFSKENNNQLNNYLDFLNDKFSNWNTMPIYLSFNNTAPSNDKYYVLRYDFLVKCIDEFINLNIVNEEFLIVLNHYKDLFV